MGEASNKGKLKLYFVVSDILTFAICWTVFYSFRKIVIESHIYGYSIPVHISIKYLLGVIGYTLLFYFIYQSSGYYKTIFRKSKLEELFLTLTNTFIGVSIVFFLVILDDYIVSYKSYYQSFFFLFTFQIIVSVFSRILITQFVKNFIKKGKIYFNTLLIGNNNVIEKTLDEFKQNYPRHGHLFKGYITVNNKTLNPQYNLQQIGGIDDIYPLVHKGDINDVLVLLDETEQQEFKIILEKINSADVDLFVNIELYYSLKRKVELSQLFKSPLIKVSRELLNPWQKTIKRIMDIVLATVCLVLSLPISLILALAIKINSKGPIFYNHERMGQYEKPFRILKFRSMYTDAESNGPQLSSKNDPRITSVGKFMRRLRLDEIPNMINVLKGEMSFVGPRPERRFYINQIIDKAPQYNRLFQLKPGVTSLGQVKFGYAETIDEMVRRMKYELFYIENFSLTLDFEILIRTIITIAKGKGI